MSVGTRKLRLLLLMHPQSDNALFLGTFPMGFATLIQLWVLICVPPWGEWSITFAWVLWMIDTIVAVLIAISLPVILYVLHYP